MSQNDATLLLKRLVHGPVLEVERWLEAVRSGQNTVPEGFNWLGLAEQAGFNARTGRLNLTVSPDLDWARIATSVYDRLAWESDPADRESLVHSSMTLRAYMIPRLGSVAGDAVLDSEMVRQWFIESTRLTPEEAADRSERWRELEIDGIRELRRIKNRLSVVKLLIDGGYFTDDILLNEWLSIAETLP